MPGFIYEMIRGSYFGRRKQWERIDTYREAFLNYDGAARESGRGFAGKTVLEVGCGDQVFTALFLLAHGCERVMLADPKLKIFNDGGRMGRALSTFRAAMPEFALSEADVRARLSCYSGLREIPDALNDSADFIFSHLVLEHFTDLDIFFSALMRLLAPDGLSFNMVDLSDHTYHIFTRFKVFSPLCARNGLNHLRYSNKTFARLNDPKCFMNRFLLPTYRQKAAGYGLDCQITQKTLLDRKVPVHRDLTGNVSDDDENDLMVTGFNMFLRK